MVSWRAKCGDLLRNERGQTATEYVLIISVIVLGLLGAASFLLPTMKTGVDTLSESLTKRFENNPLTYCDPGQGGNCE